MCGLIDNIPDPVLELEECLLRGHAESQTHIRMPALVLCGGGNTFWTLHREEKQEGRERMTTLVKMMSVFLPARPWGGGPNRGKLLFPEKAEPCGPYWTGHREGRIYHFTQDLSVWWGCGPGGEISKPPARQRGATCTCHPRKFTGRRYCPQAWVGHLHSKQTRFSVNGLGPSTWIFPEEAGISIPSLKGPLGGAPMGSQMEEF